GRHRLPRPADPRTGPLAAREGVRRGRPRTGRQRLAHHVLGAAAQPGHDDPRLRARAGGQ
ncbi:MAG: hypothetical protein AVDCRST_MAG69-2491, partial [uncultured Solirubrobacteraceae bacterium]